MASLFKRSYTKLDKATGKRVKKLTKKWYGQFVDENGLTQRVPLCTDKDAARSMLNDLIRKAERLKVGLRQPEEDHAVRPLSIHLADYKRFLIDKGSSEKHADQVHKRLVRLIEGCNFRFIPDIEAAKVLNWLATERRTQKRFSIRTSNFYQDGAKSFCKWLVTHHRASVNALSSLQRMNVETDIRHERRALQKEEFDRLIHAAHHGGVLEGLPGPDRAMLYILAAWTGYRRSELGSLTDASFDLEAAVPTVSIQATISKRRKRDRLPLHAEVVELFKQWRATKSIASGEPLFQLSTPSGYPRKTAKMMRVDLANAREAWIDEAETDQERERRRNSDFLQYKDGDGVFADFHSNRHTFVTNLAASSANPKITQTLARHSDVNLTMNVYSHVAVQEQAEAVGRLPAPPKMVAASDRLAQPAPEQIGSDSDDRLALGLALNAGSASHQVAQGDIEQPEKASMQEAENSVKPNKKAPNVIR
ncbi:hypothetical protein C2E31_10625 [Rhodopirellula baltica]|nr:hypothetical protein C2E31_10625 [Rhodopirellula baltica]